MKVLVATKETQGKRKNDFCHATEGELVVTSLECDGERIDGSCGCRRSMSGLASRKGTTTIKVVEMPITINKYANELFDSDKKAGWKLTMVEEIETAKDYARIANAFKVGDVLERRGEAFIKR